MKAKRWVLGAIASLAVAASADAITFTAGGDFSGVTEVNANHQNESLTGIILDSSTLTGTNFRRTIFDAGSFINANLDSTNLLQASFVGANLAGATLLSANLGGSNWSGANLAGVDFSGATNANLATWTGASFSASTTLPTGLSSAQLASMTFVAEPSTGLLLGVGLVGLFAFGVRTRAES